MNTLRSTSRKHIGRCCKQKPNDSRRSAHISSEGESYIARLHISEGNLRNHQQCSVSLAGYAYSALAGIHRERLDPGRAANDAVVQNSPGDSRTGVRCRSGWGKVSGEAAVRGGGVDRPNYAVLQTESALQVARATVKQYQETDRVALQYVAEESALKSSSLEVKAKLAQSQYQVVQLRDTLTTQAEYLNNLLGRDLDTPFRTQQVPPISPEEMDLTLARQTCLTQRPEVKEAEIDVHRADYDRKLAKAQYIPDIGAAFHYLEPHKHPDPSPKYRFRWLRGEMGSLRLGRAPGRREAKRNYRRAK